MHELPCPAFADGSLSVRRFAPRRLRPIPRAFEKGPRSKVGSPVARPAILLPERGA